MPDTIAADKSDDIVIKESNKDNILADNDNNIMESSDQTTSSEQIVTPWKVEAKDNQGIN